MPLQIIRNDITKVECDAIVNAANSTLLGGGGVDGAIHRAAGRELLLECMKLGGCNVGQAKITGGYKLPCKFVIHTVGPKWRGGNHGERELLESCYRNSLELAKDNGCESIAFPLISSGVYGYPMNGALRVAVDTVAEFLMDNDMLVYIVVYNKNALSAGSKLFADIAEYIDDNYVEEHSSLDRKRIVIFGESMRLPTKSFFRDDDFQESAMLEDGYSDRGEVCYSAAPMEALPTEDSIESVISNTIDESFSEMLLRKIDEKKMKDSECYKKANIDKRLFSKIRSNPDYKPSKPTVLAFCIALELSLAEANEMLMKAGFALSHSNKFDIIVEYFINHNNYNIFEINEALFAFDQNLLGSLN